MNIPASITRLLSKLLKPHLHSFILLIVCTNAPYNLFAASSSESHPQSSDPKAYWPLGFEYQVGLDFSWISPLARPEPGSMQPGNIAPETNLHNESLGDGTASWGLTRSFISTTWSRGLNDRLFLKFRPDAFPSGSNASDKVRDFDSRSGAELYRPAPSLKLLDSYYLQFDAPFWTRNQGAHTPKDQFYIRIGVFEELEPLALSYPEVLGFGLAVKMPQRFSGLEMNAQFFEELAQTASHPQGKALGSSLWQIYLFQGREERAESQVFSAKSNQTGPGSRDGYVGGAFRYSDQETGEALWHLFSERIEIIHFSFMLGYGDQKAGLGTNETFASKLNETDKISESFLTISQKFRIGGGSEDLDDKPASISPIVTLSARLAEESWSLEDKSLKLSNLTQNSFHISYLHPVYAHNLSNIPHHWYEVGAHYGTSQRHGGTLDSPKTEKAAGYQFDLGVGHSLGQDLTSQFMISEERADITQGDSKRGFFYDNSAASGKRRSHNRRFVWSLSYLTGSSHD